MLFTSFWQVLLALLGVIAVARAIATPQAKTLLPDFVSDFAHKAPLTPDDLQKGKAAHYDSAATPQPTGFPVAHFYKVTIHLTKDETTMLVQFYTLDDVYCDVYYAQWKSVMVGGAGVTLLDPRINATIAAAHSFYYVAKDPSGTDKSWSQKSGYIHHAYLHDLIPGALYSYVPACGIVEAVPATRKRDTLRAKKPKAPATTTTTPKATPTTTATTTTTTPPKKPAKATKKPSPPMKMKLVGQKTSPRFYQFRAQPRIDEQYADTRRFCVGVLGNGYTSKRAQRFHDTLDLVESSRNPLDLVLHVGEAFAEELDLRPTPYNSWDAWQEWRSPHAARVPWVFTRTSKELNAYDNGLAYQFRIPQMNNGSYHSFRYYSLRVIVLDYTISLHKDSTQFKWLKLELQKASQQRKLTPWIIVLGYEDALNPARLEQLAPLPEPAKKKAKAKHKENKKKKKKHRKRTAGDDTWSGNDAASTTSNVEWYTHASASTLAASDARKRFWSGTDADVQESALFVSATDEILEPGQTNPAKIVDNLAVLMSLFDAYGVDLYISGQERLYGRSEQLFNGNVVSSFYDFENQTSSIGTTLFGSDEWPFMGKTIGEGGHRGTIYGIVGNSDGQKTKLSEKAQQHAALLHERVIQDAPGIVRMCFDGRSSMHWEFIEDDVTMPDTKFYDPLDKVAASAQFDADSEHKKLLKQVEQDATALSKAQLNSWEEEYASAHAQTKGAQPLPPPHEGYGERQGSPADEFFVCRSDTACLVLPAKRQKLPAEYYWEYHMGYPGAGWETIEHFAKSVRVTFDEELMWNGPHKPAVDAHHTDLDFHPGQDVGHTYGQAKDDANLNAYKQKVAAFHKAHPGQADRKRWIMADHGTPIAHAKSRSSIKHHEIRTWIVFPHHKKNAENVHGDLYVRQVIRLTPEHLQLVDQLELYVMSSVSADVYVNGVLADDEALRGVNFEYREAEFNAFRKSNSTHPMGAVSLRRIVMRLDASADARWSPSSALGAQRVFLRPGDNIFAARVRAKAACYFDARLVARHAHNPAAPKIKVEFPLPPPEAGGDNALPVTHVADTKVGVGGGGTRYPTVSPTLQPTPWPTTQPTPWPTTQPTPWPTQRATLRPSAPPPTWPTQRATPRPSAPPPTWSTQRATLRPTVPPPFLPTQRPTARPLASKPVATPADNSGLPDVKTLQDLLSEARAAEEAARSALMTATATKRPTRMPTVRPTRRPVVRAKDVVGKVSPLQDSLDFGEHHKYIMPTLSPTTSPTLHPTRFPTPPPTPWPTSSPVPVNNLYFAQSANAAVAAANEAASAQSSHFAENSRPCNSAQLKQCADTCAPHYVADCKCTAEFVVHIACE